MRIQNYSQFISPFLLAYFWFLRIHKYCLVSYIKILENWEVQSHFLLCDSRKLRSTVSFPTLRFWRIEKYCLISYFRILENSLMFWSFCEILRIENYFSFLLLDPEKFYPFSFFCLCWILLGSLKSWKSSSTVWILRTLSKLSTPLF